MAEISFNQMIDNYSSVSEAKNKTCAFGTLTSLEKGHNSN